jgi:AAA15 family ATPase/GTPase
MLLEFKIRNFRSFYQETVLSMLASPRQRAHDDFLIKTDGYRILPSAVIYGPNAGGKTSIIMGLKFLKTIIDTGNIRKQKDQLLSEMVELFPFIHDYRKYSEPVHLEVTFLLDGIEYSYGLSLEARWESFDDVGDVKRAIASEYLSVDQKAIFMRKYNQVTLVKDKKTFNFYPEKTTVGLLETLERQINANLETTDLFLCGAFKSVVNSGLAGKVIRWFQEKLFPILDFDESQLVLKIPENYTNRKFIFRNQVMQAMLQHADFGPQDIRFVVDNGGDLEQNTQLRSRYQIFGNPFGKGLDIESELLESKGTIKMLEFSFPFVQALKLGSVLVVDELDASLHPDLVTALVSVFNNPTINKNGAQLIFNTHNPIYLNKNIFRRDQILFVEKNRETYESELYSLADFKTYGEKGVREDERFMKNYLSGKYGAVPFVDFEAAVYQALNDQEGEG